MSEQQINEQITGRGMLLRLAAVISMIGRVIFFLTILCVGYLLSIKAIDVLCGSGDVAAGAADAIGLPVFLLLCAFLVLAACAALSWIITGLGNIFGFSLYLLARLGTLLIVTGAVTICFSVYLRFVLRECQVGNAIFDLVVSGTVLVIGVVLQMTMIFLQGWYMSRLPKQ